jgi:hypothetical protein
MQFILKYFLKKKKIDGVYIITHVGHGTIPIVTSRNQSRLAETMAANRQILTSRNWIRRVKYSTSLIVLVA